MIDKYNEAGISTLERTGNATAKPAEKCIYPRCEDCDKYHGHYCTVPMVISKQDYIIINDKITDLMKRVLDLETLVYDEILGERSGVYVATQEEYENFSPMQKYWYDKSIADALNDAELVEGMKNLKPSINDKPVEIRTFATIKQQDKPDNLTWDDYLGEDQ